MFLFSVCSDNNLLSGNDIPTFVPSPVPEEAEKEVEETLGVLEDALSGEGDDIIPSEDEDDAISVADEHILNDDEHILNDDDEHILNYDVSDELIANTNELSESVIPAASRCTTEILTNISCIAPEPLLAPEPTIPHPCITPEPLLILPSCPVLNPCTPLEPPSINVEAPPQSEQESASDMDMGSSQSLTKKKKSKFKKFFKIRKKKKKNKLDAEQYKSTPSLSPGPSEHSQATIRSVYSMNSVLSNLDPDERNIASD